MKGWSFITAALIFIISVSCKEETHKELEAMLEMERLEESIQLLPNGNNVQIQNILADKRTNACLGKPLNVALTTFIKENQGKADISCQVVKGTVTGCFEGITTYCTVVVFPKKKDTLIVIKTGFNITH